jgi:hypothetical protein
MQNANIVSSYKYQTEIQSMMFTFGEVRTSLSETLQLVEDLLHYQAAEWVRMPERCEMSHSSCRLAR